MSSPPSKRARTEAGLCLRQAFAGEPLCRAPAQDLLRQASIALQRPLQLVRLASTLIEADGTRSWSWHELASAAEPPTGDVMLVRHAGRWRFLEQILRAASSAQRFRDLFLPPLLTRPSAPRTTLSGESREAFQERLRQVRPYLLADCKTPCISDADAEATEWSPAEHDWSALAVLLETHGSRLFLLAQKHQAAFEMQQIIGDPSRSYLVGLLERVTTDAAPEAFKALRIACSKEIESGCAGRHFRWDNNPAVIQCLAMRSEIGALALRLYFDLHDVCPRVVPESFPEARGLLQVVQISDFGYRKHLLKPVLHRLAFSSGTRVARMLTTFFVETIDAETTEKDVCKWLERFWHFDLRQLLKAIGRPVLSAPSKPVRSSWSVNPDILTTHKLFEREYRLRAHCDVLPWTAFLQQAQSQT